MHDTIQYTLSAEQTHRQMLDLHAVFPTFSEDHLELQLPAWRPGRYQLGNFAQNIQRFRAEKKDGTQLPCHKVSKDRWKIDCQGESEVVVRYNFHAAELNAGSTWVDDRQIYVNPVNCFLYIPQRQNLGYRIELKVPAHYQVATGMPKESEHVLLARDVQHVMDTPFIAADALWHRSYTSEGKTYHIWINGRIKLNEDKLISDFKAFTDVMVKRFGSIPCDEYHFLFQFPDHATRHGVEHENSTVITIGPAELLMTQHWYEELLGISCHELYHTWNIKNIRPADMMPYDFSRENYTRLGYVAEGVTTYYGDLYLMRAKVFDEPTYFKLLAGQIERHLHNAGRFNLSVADSSFDTWLDGYQPGIPHRKVSIYTEGCLTAFMTDVAILAQTNSEKSLDDAMIKLYERFGQTGKGYTEADYREICEATAGTDLSEIFDQYIYGTKDYLPALQRSLDLLGLQLVLKQGDTFGQKAGMKYKEDGNALEILTVWPGSAADAAGLAPGDRITAVEGIQADSYVSATVALAESASIEVDFIRNRQRRHTTIQLSDERYYPKAEIRKVKESPLYKAWSMQ